MVRQCFGLGGSGVGFSGVVRSMGGFVFMVLYKANTLGTV